jgi:hypothetical protein
MGMMDLMAASGTNLLMVAIMPATVSVIICNKEYTKQKEAETHHSSL